MTAKGHNSSKSMLWERYQLFLVSLLILSKAGASNATPLPVQHTPYSSTVTPLPLQSTCGQVCRFSNWFKRALCKEAGLQYVPLANGCEDAYMLELQDNVIMSINAHTLSRYRRLRTLDISRNEIRVINPGTFLEINHLKNFLASENKLQVLYNNTFKGAEKHLVRIYLNNNRVVNINSDAFLGLKNLQLLHLSHNKIRFLPTNVFRSLVKLQFLFLGGNEITEIDSRIFQGLTKLQSMILDRNHLSYLPEGLFACLISLRELVLSKNKLVTIPPPESLGLSSGLEMLNLTHNRLNQSNVILPYLNLSDRLYIDHNPFVCDCDFRKIQEMHLNGQIETSQLRCKLDRTYFHVSELLPVTCHLTTYATVLISQQQITKRQEMKSSTKTTVDQVSDDSDTLNVSKGGPEHFRSVSYHGESSSYKDTLVPFDKSTKLLLITNVSLTASILMLLTVVIITLIISLSRKTKR